MFNITHHQGYTNQNHSEITPHTYQNGYNEKHKKQQVLVRMWRKGNTFALLVGMRADAATLENSMEASQKVKNRTTYNLAISLQGIHPKDTKILI